jgi:hypothetical protein
LRRLQFFCSKIEACSSLYGSSTSAACALPWQQESQTCKTVFVLLLTLSYRMPASKTRIKLSNYHPVIQKRRRKSCILAHLTLGTSIITDNTTSEINNQKIRVNVRISCFYSVKLVCKAEDRGFSGRQLTVRNSRTDCFGAKVPRLHKLVISLSPIQIASCLIHTIKGWLTRSSQALGVHDHIGLIVFPLLLPLAN